VEHSNHAGHAAPASASADPGKPVNTVCAICGMDVDPRMPTAEYQGKTIGFGCRMCPPKFKADPDRYGPLYLKNEVVKR
jgi:YHS domain-containing protein